MIRRLILGIFALIGVACLTLTADTSGASIKFDTTTIDLGRIPANGGKVKFEYPFVNKGDSPLIIVSVSNGGCGCTKPEFPRQPISAGAHDKIVITFDPTGRRGELNREVVVRCNGNPKKVKLHFKGVVIP